jgi:hypothetical protein
MAAFTTIPDTWFTLARGITAGLDIRLTSGSVLAAAFVFVCDGRLWLFVTNWVKGFTTGITGGSQRAQGKAGRSRRCLLVLIPP